MGHSPVRTANAERIFRIRGSRDHARETAIAVKTRLRPWQCVLPMNALHRVDLVRCFDERQIGHQWGFIDQLPLPPAEPVGTLPAARRAESSA